MNSPKSITKKNPTKDIDQLQPRDASPAASAAKGGEHMHVEITPDRIRVRAYEIYQARNGAPGDPESDWLQAEREFKGQPSSGSAPGYLNAEPTLLEINTRPESLRQPAMSVRGGL